MANCQIWLVTKVDDKISSVSTGQSGAVAALEHLSPGRKAERIMVSRMNTEELFDFSQRLAWEDLQPRGSAFQKEVWHALFKLTHGDIRFQHPGDVPGLLSYSRLAEILGRPGAVRAVAHAVACNPVPVIIPCHLVIPLAAYRRLEDLRLETSLFEWDALAMVDKKIDYGEYALGAELKRRLIRYHINSLYKRFRCPQGC